MRKRPSARSSPGKTRILSWTSLVLSSACHLRGLAAAFDFVGFLQHCLNTLLVLALVAAEQFHHVQPLGLDQAQCNRLHRQAVLDALDEAVLEVQAHRQLELVDAARMGAVFPEQAAEEAGRLHLRCLAEPMRVFGDAVHDVSDRQLARAAHDAVVAGGAVPHRGGGQHFLALAGADHHEEFLRRVLPGALEVGRAGTGADAALHAHLHPVAQLDLFFDFLQEVVAVFRRHCGICAHVGVSCQKPLNGLGPTATSSSAYLLIIAGTRSMSVIATSRSRTRSDSRFRVFSVSSILDMRTRPSSDPLTKWHWYSSPDLQPIIITPSYPAFSASVTQMVLTEPRQ